MPWTNVCKKCKAETPCGETCAHCGAKLTKTGERLATICPHVPVRDWFCWNRALRVALPVYVLVFLLFVLLEACTRGEAGVRRLFAEGFASVMLGLLALLALLVLGVLLLQGPEVIRTTLGKDGAEQLVYLRKPTPLRLLARGTSVGGIAALQSEGEPLPGYTLVQRRTLRWADVKRVGEWPERRILLLYCPAWWLGLHCAFPAQEYEEARDYIRKKCRLTRAKRKKK